MVPSHASSARLSPNHSMDCGIARFLGIDGVQRHTHVLHPGHGAKPRQFGAVVAEPLGGLGDRETLWNQGGGVGGRIGTRPWVIGVVSLDHIESEPGVVRRQGEHGDAVQGGAGRHHALLAAATSGRLQADDVVEARRDPARARGIGAQRQWDQSLGDRHRGTGAGTAGDVGAIEGIDDCAVRGAGPREARGELIEVGLADQHRPGGLEPRHRRGAVRRVVGKAGTACGGRPPRRVEVILDGKRDAVQGQ